jgi:hypothetical protein
VMRTDMTWVLSVLGISPLTQLRTISCKLCFRSELNGVVCIPVERRVQPIRVGSLLWGLAMRLSLLTIRTVLLWNLSKLFEIGQFLWYNPVSG